MNETVISPDSAAPASDAAGFFILHHVMVDLSVENPFGRIPDDAAAGLRLSHEVAVSTAPLGEPETHGVNVFQRLTATVGEHVAFLAELNYRIEVRLQGIAADDVARVLEVEVPESLAPVLRAILEQNGAFAGYPEMRLDGLGFAEAFAQRATAH
jgi:preprotein translocase subunit SecB